MKNLPMDLLRTFVTISDLGGFTHAGELLGRSQPAISLQVKRLEEMLDVQLFNRSSGLQLTEEGQLLYNFARKILEMNDTLVSRLTSPAISGSVRLGIPNDFEVSFVPVMLSKFIRSYPNITLDVSSDLSINLRQDFKKGSYDLVMSMDEYPEHTFAEGDFIVERLSWVTGPSFSLHKDQTVPLVVYPKGCIYRQHIIEALNNASIPWRVLYCSSSLLGIQSTIEAGLGISALAHNAVPKALLQHESYQELPELGNVTIGFNYDDNNLAPAVELLLEHLRRGLMQNGDYTPQFKHHP
ncbi:LysR substrate-binding domain-containing protein [Motiliproteus sp. MSK22-1]|uniref:LysR substrate-binding domain-containing protein n=1 Tax=Motiliproteus sp. MSK22-1 TaxID=1897630 RepID=UPI0009764CFA|nr:LysR substrate-binding domain-containing protein [Motiliproteus sp. MSK22-1]OMH29051.1 LysR family transcriptional regulator [Motiliproteus sp. MSK22-1]